MTSSRGAPKQWRLTKNEIITSYESWRQNLPYVLSLARNFAPVLESTWQKKSASDHGEAIPEASRLTAVQTNTRLELLLGLIANFCPELYCKKARLLSTSSGRRYDNIMASSPPARTFSTKPPLPACRVMAYTHPFWCTPPCETEVRVRIAQ